MEFNQAVAGLKGDGVSQWDSKRIAALTNEDRERFRSLVDHFGKLSAKAQGLTRPVTDLTRILNSDQKLYLWSKALANNKLLLLGGLKTGRKHLYIRMETGTYRHIEPVCVLDFYVHESLQRRGIGKQLFEAFMIADGQTPASLAYDKPSPKLLAFLYRHYGLRNYVPQTNNFVVFAAYWQCASMSGQDRAENPTWATVSMRPLTGQKSTRLAGAAPPPPLGAPLGAPMMHAAGQTSSGLGRRLSRGNSGAWFRPEPPPAQQPCTSSREQANSLGWTSEAAGAGQEWLPAQPSYQAESAEPSYMRAGATQPASEGLQSHAWRQQHSGAPSQRSPSKSIGLAGTMSGFAAADANMAADDSSLRDSLDSFKEAMRLQTDIGGCSDRRALQQSQDAGHAQQSSAASLDRSKQLSVQNALSLDKRQPYQTEAHSRHDSIPAKHWQPTGEQRWQESSGEQSTNAQLPAFASANSSPDRTAANEAASMHGIQGRPMPSSRPMYPAGRPPRSISRSSLQPPWALSNAGEAATSNEYKSHRHGTLAAVGQHGTAGRSNTDLFTGFTANADLHLTAARVAAAAQRAGRGARDCLAW